MTNKNRKNLRTIPIFQSGVSGRSTSFRFRLASALSILPLQGGWMLWDTLPRAAWSTACPGLWYYALAGRFLRNPTIAA